MYRCMPRVSNAARRRAAACAAKRCLPSVPRVSIHSPVAIRRNLGISRELSIGGKTRKKYTKLFLACFDDIYNSSHLRRRQCRRRQQRGRRQRRRRPPFLGSESTFQDCVLRCGGIFGLRDSSFERSSNTNNPVGVERNRLWIRETDANSDCFRLLVRLLLLLLLLLFLIASTKERFHLSLGTTNCRCCSPKRALNAITSSSPSPSPSLEKTSSLSLSSSSPPSSSSTD